MGSTVLRRDSGFAGGGLFVPDLITPATAIGDEVGCPPTVQFNSRSRARN
jgi:hypothetical protein